MLRNNSIEGFFSLFFSLPFTLLNFQKRQSDKNNANQIRMSLLNSTKPHIYLFLFFSPSIQHQLWIENIQNNKKRAHYELNILYKYMFQCTFNMNGVIKKTANQKWIWKNKKSRFAPLLFVMRTFLADADFLMKNLPRCHFISF